MIDSAALLVRSWAVGQYLEDVEWMTLVFVMDLFVMVGALVEVGVISSLGPASPRRSATTTCWPAPA